ncbi:MAG: hypothetical protein ACHQX1_02395 [Candidatus Micrarchaeales archaeon]
MIDKKKAEKESEPMLITYVSYARAERPKVTMFLPKGNRRISDEFKTWASLLPESMFDVRLRCRNGKAMMRVDGMKCLTVDAIKEEIIRLRGWKRQYGIL